MDFLRDGRENSVIFRKTKPRQQTGQELELKSWFWDNRSVEAVLALG